jgi:hypothetical protein
MAAEVDGAGSAGAEDDDAATAAAADDGADEDADDGIVCPEGAVPGAAE